MALLRLLALGVALCSVTFLAGVAWRVEHMSSHDLQNALTEARRLGAEAQAQLRAASVALSPGEGSAFLEAFAEEGWLPEGRSAPTRRPPLPHPDCLGSLAELTEAERRPRKGPRHMVEPPASSTVLVCCATTKGALSIAAHPAWAPRGAQRFLDMVTTGHFSSKVAMFRCVEGFICQFGIAGDPEVNRRTHRSFPDDPSWLPLGPENRRNKEGVVRFPKGYLAYAGGGPNTRGNQLIVALEDQERLCGGSPWEVPWGEVVGERSFHTLDNFYTGYGENGPSQGRLTNRGVDQELMELFPDLDFITQCAVVDSDQPDTAARRLRR